MDTRVVLEFIEEKVRAEQVAKDHSTHMTVKNNFDMLELRRVKEQLSKLVSEDELKDKKKKKGNKK